MENRRASSLIVIVDVDNFDRVIIAIHKNRPVGEGDSETVDSEVARFENFCVESRMERVLSEQARLLLELLQDSPPLEIERKSFRKWRDLHTTGSAMARNGKILANPVQSFLETLRGRGLSCEMTK